jgi:predicted RNA-binding Zn-ribbon protein involved in translation (DUF1610 family)
LSSCTRIGLHRGRFDETARQSSIRSSSSLRLRQAREFQETLTYTHVLFQDPAVTITLLEYANTFFCSNGFACRPLSFAPIIQVADFSLDRNLIVTRATPIDATPLPESLPLFLTGLGAIGLLGWRRKRKGAAAIAARPGPAVRRSVAPRQLSEQNRYLVAPPKTAALAFDAQQPHTKLMVQIRPSDSTDDFTCPHCGTVYEVISESPARDSGSAECEVCNRIMKQWTDSAIPLFRVKKRAKGA